MTELNNKPNRECTEMTDKNVTNERLAQLQADPDIASSVDAQRCMPDILTSEVLAGLRLATENTTPGSWRCEDDDWSDGDNAVITCDARDGMVQIATLSSGGSVPDSTPAFSTEQRANAGFIAAFNPIIARALLDALEVRHEQNQHLQQRLKNVQESAAGQLFMAKKRVAELENRPCAPVSFSENADTDFCREWGWREIKQDLPSENWSISESAGFYAFYLMGWNFRRQYNEQRGEDAERKLLAENERMRRILKAFIDEAHEIADARDCPFGVRALDWLRQQIKLMGEMERELAARDAALRAITLKDGVVREVDND